MLRQTLGGNSYSLMIACITPNDRFIDENMSTIMYAAKASKISNKPMKNDDPKSKLIEMLKRQNKILTVELRKANEYIQSLCTLKGIEDAPIFGGENFAQHQAEI